MGSLFLLIVYEHQGPEGANKPYWPSSTALWAQEALFSPPCFLAGDTGMDPGWEGAASPRGILTVR